MTQTDSTRSNNNNSSSSRDACESRHLRYQCRFKSGAAVIATAAAVAAAATAFSSIIVSCQAIKAARGTESSKRLKRKNASAIPPQIVGCASTTVTQAVAWVASEPELTSFR